jgi:tRNA threonylcarbamoyladenosine biosynthesis protein TsaB
MIVLGFDTSTSATAVALQLADGPISEARDDPPAGAHPGHATRLLVLADELLERAGIDWPQVQRVAAGAGPGTFTGLRVGLATAHGLAQSLGAELVAVSSLQALARSAQQGGFRSPLLAVIDARRGEVFAAAYGADAQELLAPRPVAPESLGELPAQVAALAGCAAGGWPAVGDGAVRYRPVLEAAGIVPAPQGSPLHRVSARAICELGAAMPLPSSPAEVLPDYRRRPDAELALAASGAPAVAGADR